MTNINSAPPKRHGLRHHPLYNTWRGMKQRCSDPNHNRYNNYGNRNIKVCSGWINDFMAFYNWAIKNGWQKNLTIDRRDNDGNYEPSNCRFLTRAENNRDTTRTKLNWGSVTEIRNTKLLLGNLIKGVELARAYGVSKSTISKILANKKWEIL